MNEPRYRQLDPLNPEQDLRPPSARRKRENAYVGATFIVGAVVWLMLTGVAVGLGSWALAVIAFGLFAVAVVACVAMAAYYDHREKRQR